MERGEWLTSTSVWVERPAPKEEGLQKSDGNGLGASQSGRGGEGGSVFNHGVNPQLRIIENLGSMTQAACTENFRLPVGADGREICLCFSSKGDCNRSCTRSHAPIRGHTQESELRLIRGAREATNKFNKKNLMASEIRTPTGDTGTGAEFTDIGTWRLRTVRDLVAAVVEAETEITAEAAVREGEMFQTPTPPPRRTENSGRQRERSRRS